jgi:hypothetical protein
MIEPYDTAFSVTLSSIFGCDSVINVYANIHPSYRHVDIDTICSNELYIWQYDTIEHLEAGDYIHETVYPTQNANCDSTFTLYLHVKQAYNMMRYDTICENEFYVFYQDTLTQPGIYHDTIYTHNGCDSVTTLHLTVLDTTLNIIYDTICITENYIFHHTALSEPGAYEFLSLNSSNCLQTDSIYLTVVDTSRYEILIGDILCADDEEIIVNYDLISGPELIEYSIIFDQFGHLQGFKDIYHAPLNTRYDYFTIPIPRGEALPHPKPTYFDSQQGINAYTHDDKYAYPQPNNYHMTIIMHNAICGDTLQHKDTTFNLKYPSWIHEQHWNDGIVLYNETYNGGHKFSAYQWYQNGQPLIGETKEYLYIPSNLLMNLSGECDNYYQVLLTRAEDGHTSITCPICPIALEDTIVPTKDYFSVVPTLVVQENPVIHILSTKPVKIAITSLTGQLLLPLTDEYMYPDDKNYAGQVIIPHAVSGCVEVTLVTIDGEIRTTQVIIK